MIFNLSRRLGLLALYGSLFCTPLSANAGISMVITSSPPLREVIVEPEGYTRCYTVPQGFYRGVWQYRHRVCEYEGRDAPRVWISGYWQCVNYLPNGRCMRTAWMRSRWAISADREYRMAYERYPRNYHQRRDHFEQMAPRYEEPVVIRRGERLAPPVIHRRDEAYGRGGPAVIERRTEVRDRHNQHGPR